jgi:hypothetical protein
MDKILGLSVAGGNEFYRKRQENLSFYLNLVAFGPTVFS